MGICQETTLEVQIAEGAEIGLDRVRKEVEAEIQNAAGEDDGEEEKE